MSWSPISTPSQAVVGGATDAVERIIERFAAAGINATRIPVSHAFHTQIVAPCRCPSSTRCAASTSSPRRCRSSPMSPGSSIPSDATTETMLDYTGRQIASPVQFVAGLETLDCRGARVFVEVGPKKALHGFVEDVLGSQVYDDVVALYTNHPKVADEVAATRPSTVCMPRAWVSPTPPVTHAAAPAAAPTAGRGPARRLVWPRAGPGGPAAIRPASQGSAVRSVPSPSSANSSCPRRGLCAYAGTWDTTRARPRRRPARAGGSGSRACATSRSSSPVRPSACRVSTGLRRCQYRADPRRPELHQLLSPRLRQMMVDKRVTRIVRTRRAKR